MSASGLHLIFATGAQLPITPNTLFTTYSFAQLVHLTPDSDALALTVRTALNDIEQFVLKTTQVFTWHLSYCTCIVLYFVTQSYMYSSALKLQHTSLYTVQIRTLTLSFINYHSIYSHKGLH